MTEKQLRSQIRILQKQFNHYGFSDLTRLKWNNVLDQNTIKNSKKDDFEQANMIFLALLKSVIINHSKYYKKRSQKRYINKMVKSLNFGW